MRKLAKTPEEKRLAHEAWYDEQVRLGLEDIEAGRLVSHDEALIHMERTLAELEKQHAHKAA